MRGINEEKNDLAMAERHIISIKLAISAQHWRIERQKNAGLNTDDSETLLRLMETIRQTFREHRQLILEALACMDCEDTISITLRPLKGRHWAPNGS
jgi:hypothetical protein